MIVRAQAVIDWAACPVLEGVPDGRGGVEWVFRGTQIPYSAVLDNISTITADQILERYPGLDREQILQFLRFVARSARPLEPSHELSGAAS